MTDKYYSLNELSSLTGLPTRTIHFYRREGLLSRPSGRGRKSRYGRPHLDALVTIQQLQYEGRSLKEIKEAMAAAPEYCLPQASSEPEASAPHAAKKPKGPHLPKALRDSMAKAREKAARLAQGASGVTVPFEPMMHHAVQAPLDVEHSSHWVRIPITPKIEVHVRQPLSRKEKHALQGLLEQAKDLFEGARDD